MFISHHSELIQGDFCMNIVSWVWQNHEVEFRNLWHCNRYFSSLQKELSTYDRVLYEMVADKDKLQTNRLGKLRWRPPRRLPGRRGGQGFSIIGFIQRVMASILTLEFQLECMDYRRENWYHADLDFDTFQVLQVRLHWHDLILTVQSSSVFVVLRALWAGFCFWFRYQYKLLWF